MLLPQDWLASPTVPGGGPGGPLGAGEGAAMVRPMLNTARLRRESFMLEKSVGTWLLRNYCCEFQVVDRKRMLVLIQRISMVKRPVFIENTAYHDKTEPCVSHNLFRRLIKD